MLDFHATLGIKYLHAIFTGNPDIPDESNAPPSYVYQPNHCQAVYANLSFNRERNLGVLTAINFNKLDDHTVLRITWEVCSCDATEKSHDPTITG